MILDWRAVYTATHLDFGRDIRRHIAGPVF
jgi:hypothetical protein